MGLIKVFGESSYNNIKRDISISTYRIDYVAETSEVDNPVKADAPKVPVSFIASDKCSYSIYVCIPADVLGELIAVTQAMGDNAVLDLRTHSYYSKNKGLDPYTGFSLPLPEPQWLDIPEKPEQGKPVSKIKKVSAPGS